MADKQKQPAHPSDGERAKALVREHFDQIDAIWQRNHSLRDLIGLLRVDGDGGWSVGMSHRQDKIEEVPEMLEHFPQLAQPAWKAHPEFLPGTAMWLIVGAPPYWRCLRVHKTIRMVPGGSA